jgi:branched-chain amino acid aminotransferase
MNCFIHNGKFFKEGTPVIGAGNRGFRYGDGLFETIRYHGGRLVQAEEHFARLWKGLKIMQFSIPSHFTPELLHEAILVLAKKNGHDSNARVRLTVFRGEGGLYDCTSQQPAYIIQTWLLSDGTGEWNSNGLVCGICDSVRKSQDVLSNLKHNNFLPYAMAAFHAKQQKWNDAILLNSADRICDSTIANVFMIKNGKVFTPALSEGCIAGVTRRHFLRQLPVAGYSVTEKEITAAELEGADEVFFTNSIYNMRWVQSIGNRHYGHTVSAKIYSLVVPTI